MSDPAERTDLIYSESGIPLKKHYRPEDLAKFDYDRDLGDPGQAPFTRGPYPDMYRARLWRIAQLVGAGHPEEHNSLVRFAQEQGGGWVPFEPDQITTCHLWDPDHPEVIARKHDVGLTGAPFIGLPDFESLLEGVDMERSYFHMVGDPWIHAGFFAVAEQRSIPLNRLRGTGQGEMFIPYLSCPFKDPYPPRAKLENNCDLIEFHVAHVPHVVPVSCAGHDVRANGISAWQELAIVLAWNVDHIEAVLRRGHLLIEQFVHTLGGVNYSIGRDFFEEICKLRAARRMWAKLLRDRYHITDPKLARLRIHGFSADRDYTSEQALVNIVRSAYRTVAAALGGVQSLGVGPYDEGLAVPSLEAILTAIRTQQVIQLESGIPNVADPLAGSYYVEWLTDELEERAWEYLAKIESEGGFVATLESGWLHRECYSSAIEQERRLESGEKKLVGFNCFRVTEDTTKAKPYRSEQSWDGAMARLEQMRCERDEGRVRKALDELRSALADPDTNQMPAMIEAMKAWVTVGEVGEAYRDVWGIWNPPLPL